jgi:nucleotide-binding universal stress UspA family protein
MKVLLAIDDSQPSDAAVAAIASRPWPERSTVRVLSVFEAFEPSMLTPGAAPFVVPPPTAATSEIQQRNEEVANQVVTRAAEKLQQDSDLYVETAVRSGEPRRTILDDANDSKADLIVVGSHGRTGVKRWLLGSVAEYVVRNAPCSVEVVRGGE